MAANSFYSLFTIYHSPSLNAERLHLTVLARKLPHEDGARDVDGREQVGEQAEHERDGEAADRPRPEDEEEQRRDDGRHVRVDDGDEGAREANVDGRGHGLAGVQLLA